LLSDVLVDHLPCDLGPLTHRAEVLGAELIDRDDYGSVPQYDALFIRETLGSVVTPTVMLSRL
jgi:hypothetical protein